MICAPVTWGSEGDYEGGLESLVDGDCTNMLDVYYLFLVVSSQSSLVYSLRIC